MSTVGQACKDHDEGIHPHALVPDKAPREIEILHPSGTGCHIHVSLFIGHEMARVERQFAQLHDALGGLKNTYGLETLSAADRAVGNGRANHYPDRIPVQDGVLDIEAHLRTFEGFQTAVYHLGIPIQPCRFGGYERRGDLRGFAGACAACGGEQKEKYDEMIDFHGFGFYV